MSATKIKSGEYAYRGHEIIRDAHGWQVRKAGNGRAILHPVSKAQAITLIDEYIDAEIVEDRSDMTTAELIAIDGVGWAWLEQPSV